MRTYQNHDDYLHEVLKDPKEAALMLNAAVDEEDPGLILDVLSKIAKAHGVSAMAKKTSLSRMGLYKSLSKSGNPGFKTLLGILAASGLKMSFQVAKAAKRAT